MVEAVAREFDYRFSEVGDGNRGQVISFLAKILLLQPEGPLQVPHYRRASVSLSSVL